MFLSLAFYIPLCISSWWDRNQSGSDPEPISLHYVAWWWGWAGIEGGGRIYLLHGWCCLLLIQFSSLSCVRLFVTPWTTAHQASLSITNSQSLPKLMSIESVMPSSHVILCHPLLLLLSIFPSIRVFSNESAFRIRWPKYWSFSFHISPSNDHPGLMPFRLALLAVKGLLIASYHYFSLHPLKRHVMSVCPNTGDVKLNSLV